VVDVTAALLRIQAMLSNRVSELLPRRWLLRTPVALPTCATPSVRMGRRPERSNAMFRARNSRDGGGSGVGVVVTLSQGGDFPVPGQRVRPNELEPHPWRQPASIGGGQLTSTRYHHRSTGNDQGGRRAPLSLTAQGS
jgi:hypothetical protein